MKDTKHNYELVVVFNPKTDDKEKEKNLKKIADWMQGDSAEVVSTDHVGLKNFVYKVRGLDKGDFYVFQVSANKPLKLKEFNIFLNREPSIIRYLIIKK